MRVPDAIPRIDRAISVSRRVKPEVFGGVGEELMRQLCMAQTVFYCMVLLLSCTASVLHSVLVFISLSN